MKKKKKRKMNSEHTNFLMGIIIIIIIIILYLRELARKIKTDELEALKKKIQSNIELDKALKDRVERIYKKIRYFLIFLYFSINIITYFIFCFKKIPFFDCLGDFLNCNTVFFIIITAFTFAKFGNFSSYHKWFDLTKTKTEAIIYKNYPDIREIIKNDIKYKEQLEAEINSLKIN